MWSAGVAVEVVVVPGWVFVCLLAGESHFSQRTARRRLPVCCVGLSELALALQLGEFGLFGENLVAALLHGRLHGGRAWAWARAWARAWWIWPAWARGARVYELVQDSRGMRLYVQCNAPPANKETEQQSNRATEPQRISNKGAKHATTLSPCRRVVASPCCRATCQCPPTARQAVARGPGAMSDRNLAQRPSSINSTSKPARPRSRPRRRPSPRPASTLRSIAAPRPHSAAIGLAGPRHPAQVVAPPALRHVYFCRRQCTAHPHTKPLQCSRPAATTTAITTTTATTTWMLTATLLGPSMVRSRRWSLLWRLPSNVHIRPREAAAREQKIRAPPVVD